MHYFFLFVHLGVGTSEKTIAKASAKIGAGETIKKKNRLGNVIMVEQQ